MGGLQSLPVQEILSRGSIKDSDVARFRRILYEDGIVAADECDLLFKLNSSCDIQEPDWPPFFIEAVTDFIVFQERPQGYLTADNAHWLLERVAKPGKMLSKTEFELIVNVIDKARWAPVSLAKYAMEQVKQAVITGKGPTRQGRASEPGSITDAEVDVLRRILYAFAGDGHVAITRD
jgi:hypothetical protein